MRYNIEEVSKKVITNVDGTIISSEFDEIKRAIFDGQESNDIFYVCRDGLWCIYDAKSNFKTGMIFSDISEFFNGLAIVTRINRNKKLYNIMNDQFDIIQLSEHYYDEIRRCKNGLLTTRFNSKYGVVGCDGKEILECEYDEVYDKDFIKCFDKEYIALRKGDHIVLVDEKAEVYPISKK